VSGDDDKPSPLWKFVSGAPYVPGPRPPAYREKQLAQEQAPQYKYEEAPEEGDLEPLRVHGDWAPMSILERLGPAPTDEEALSYLIVACGVLEGARRLAELCGKVEYLSIASGPKLDVMLKDKTLEPQHPRIQEFLDAVTRSRREIPGTKARASNDAHGHRPDGLRVYDLRNLVHFIHAVIGATEVSGRRNLLAIDFALQYIDRLPNMHFVETWLDRILPSASLQSVQLIEPEELHRVVVVFNDGRLAYDPRAEIEEEEEWDDAPAARGNDHGYEDDGDEWEYEEEDEWVDEEDEASASDDDGEEEWVYEDADPESDEDDGEWVYEEADAKPDATASAKPQVGEDDDDEWVYEEVDAKPATATAKAEGDDDDDGEWVYEEVDADDDEDGEWVYEEVEE